MKEGCRGVEALATYPLKDIVLSSDEALSQLTKRVRKNYVDNSNRIISSFDPKSSEILFPPKIDPSKIIIEELPEMYERWGNFTLKRATMKAMEELFPEILDKEDPVKNSNSLCVMHLLNTLRIIDPRIASFEEGVVMMVKGVKKSNTFPSSFTLLGGILGEAINLKGTEDAPFDLFVDVEGAQILKNHILHSANEWERLEFGIGLDYANETQVKRMPFSRS